MPQTITLFIVLILLSGFFSGVEIAFFSLSNSSVRTLVRKNLPGAKTVERLKDNPQRLLVVILLGNNLVNIFAAAIATELALSSFGSLGIGIATGIVTFLVLVFGEIFPKSLSQIYAAEIARFTAKPILLIEYILFPFVWFLEKLSYLVTKLTSGKTQPDIKIEEEISSMLHLGLEEGSIEHHEKEFVERLFRFNDVSVKTIVTPIEKVVMLDGERAIEKIIHFAANSGYSRFPVYEDNRQNIIGTIHIKDIVKANNSAGRDNPLATIVQKSLLVTEDSILDDVFDQMKKSYANYLLVKNNQGDITGVLTLEDIMEELVGEIYDESDQRKKECGNLRFYSYLSIAKNM